MTTKATKTPRAAGAKPDANGNGQATSPARPPLEELTMRAYRATYERLHGKGSKRKRQTTPDAPKPHAA